MKKKFTVLLSFILAFVMCFALAACNGEGGAGGNGPATRPAVTINADTVATAFERLADVNGFKGEAKLTFTSDNTDDEYTLSFDKRGDRVKCTVGDASYIVDLESGNVYGMLDDGTYGYRQYLPVGMLDYVEYMLGELPLQGGKTDLSDIKFTYNAATKTATYGKDLASKLNKYLTPITKAYDLGKPIKAVIDDYLDMFDMMSVDGIIALAKINKDQTVDSLLAMMDDAGFGGAGTVDAIRAAIEENLDEATAEKIFDRKVGEIVAGLNEFLTELAGSQMPVAAVAAADETTSDGTGEITGGGIVGMQPAMEEMLAALFDYAIEREYTAEQVSKAIDSMDGLINGVLGISVKNIVDQYVADMSDELYAAIKNKIKFGKLGAELNVGLEASGDAYTVTGFEIVAQCKHNYTGEVGEGWTILADNNYVATLSVAIGEYYTTAPADFDITLSPDAEAASTVLGVVYGTLESDYTVKLELGGNAVTTVTANGAYLILGENVAELALPDNGSIVSFDAATGCVKLDKQFINTALADIGIHSDGAAMPPILVVSISFDDEVEYVIQLIKLPDTVDGLLDMIKNIATDMPDMPDDTPIEGEAEALRVPLC